MHIGIRIKMARIARQLTQQDLAEKIHRTRPLISHIEQTGNVHQDTLKKICQVLNMTYDQLNKVGESSHGYHSASDEQVSKLKEEIEKLERENSLLREIKEFQKNKIEDLEKKLKKKKNP
jgi:transcriptional regulator with XRE-family HTH domain